jgi:tetratricopeptide (TPR) repeat protein/CBS domain-containing protein
MTRVIHAFLMAGMLVALTSPCRADDPDGDIKKKAPTPKKADVKEDSAEPPVRKKLYPVILQSTVLVSSKYGSGTGWCVDAKRKWIVTNHHVVRDDESVKITLPAYQDGRPVLERAYYNQKAVPLNGAVLDAVLGVDLALIHVPNLPDSVRPIELASASAETQDTIHSVGNPAASGALWVYSTGQVRAVYRREWTGISGNFRDARKARVMETTAGINGGDSGSPVVDDSGKLVGVISASIGQNIAICIDVSEVRDYVREVAELQDAKTAEQFIRRGVRQSRNGWKSRAIKDFTSAIRLEPKNSNAYLQRAMVYNQLNDYAAAIDDCDEGLKLAPTDAAFFNERGVAYYRQKKYDAAIKDFRKATQFDAEVALYHSNKADTHMELDQLDDAVASWSEAIRINPNSATYVNLRGITYFRMNKMKPAADDFSAALKLNNTESVYWINRADARRHLDDYDGAINDCLEGLKITPKYAHAYFILGESLHGKKDFKSAAGAFTKVIEINSQHAKAYMGRANALAALGESELAERDFAAALRIDPKLKDSRKLYRTAILRVSNQSKHTIRVYVAYETLTDQGTWHWYRMDNPAVFVFQPGEEARLRDEGWIIQARRMRIWAESTDGNMSWQKVRNTDTWLIDEKGVKAVDQPTYTYKFLP